MQSRADAVVRVAYQAGHLKPDAPGAAAIEERLRELADLQMLRDVSIRTLADLAASSETVTYASGETIVVEGEPGDSIYIVLEGRVDVLARSVRNGVVTESSVATLAEGDALGELTIVDGRPRSASCVAVRPTRCLRLRRDVVWSEMRRDWALNEAMLLTMAHRLRQADAVMAEHARDPLAGVYNRRALFDVYEREVRRAARAARRATADQPLLPPALLFVDIAGFNAINDRHGHRTGDDVLRSLGLLLTRCARTTDHVARYGADQFVILLPEAGQAGANLLGARITDEMAGNPPGPVPFGLCLRSVLVDVDSPVPLQQIIDEHAAGKQRQRAAAPVPAEAS